MNTDDKPSIYTILNRITSPLSIFAGLLVICYCCRMNKITISIKLILALVVSDILYSFSNLISIFRHTEEGLLCSAQSSLSIFSFALSMFMASSIALLHFKFAVPNPEFDQSKFFVKTVLTGITVSLLFSFGPIYSKKIIVLYADSLGCYQDFAGDATDKLGNFGYFLFSNTPVLTAPIVSLVLYILAVKRLRRTSEMLLGEVHIETGTLFWYPAVLFMTLLPYTVITILNYCTKVQVPEALSVVNFVLFNSLGLINAVTYSIQRRIYQKQKMVYESRIKQSAFGDMKDSLGWDSVLVPMAKAE